MGTDIHFYVERRGAAGGWESCDTWEPSEYDDHALTVPYGKHFYEGRNYDLFAILANVRNGSGFAGCDTGDGFIPIVEPRGLPADLSPQLRAEAGRYLEHTPSWLLISEIMAYDWTQVTTKRGWVSMGQYIDWVSWRRGQGLGPDSWSGGISGPVIEHITEQEMERRVVALSDDEKQALRRAAKGDPFGGSGPGARYYCAVSWTTPYYRAAGSFLNETLPRLWRVGPPGDVRVVFWFDS